MSLRSVTVTAISIVIAIVLAASARVASAQPVDEARALYDRGLQHYNLGEYRAAIDAWKEAYRISHAPLLLFNIGQAYRLSGDCTNARIFYATYRREEPAPPNETELAAAEELCPEPTKPPPPPVVENEQPVTAPTPIPPTKPALVATAPATPSSAGRSRRLAGLALTGTGVAAALAGGYFLRSSAAASADVEAADGEWTPALADLEARGRRDQTIGLAAAGAGVALVSAGAVLYVLGRRADAVEVAPTAGGATVAFRTRF